MQPNVSVIIPVFNDTLNLRVCLLSLFDGEFKNFEVIVVDDASTTNIRAVTDDFPCRYIRLPENQGQAYARNVGAAESQGDMLLFIDSDCQANKDWVSNISDCLVSFHQQDKQVVAVCGQLQSAKGFVPMSHAYAGYAYVLGGNRREMAYLNTSCVAILREAFFDVGGFAEDMRNGEDPELALRLIEKGQKVIFEPSIWVIHHHGVHTLKDMVLKHKRWGHALGLSLMQKHPSRFKVILPILSLPVTHFLSIVPLALATTVKIMAYNFKDDKRVVLYFPGILLNKLFFRWGIFIRSLRHG